MVGAKRPEPEVKRVRPCCLSHQRISPSRQASFDLSWNLEGSKHLVCRQKVTGEKLKKGNQSPIVPWFSNNITCWHIENLLRLKAWPHASNNWNFWTQQLWPVKLRGSEQVCLITETVTKDKESSFFYPYSSTSKACGTNGLLLLDQKLSVWQPSGFVPGLYQYTNFTDT